MTGPARPPATSRPDEAPHVGGAPAAAGAAGALRTVHVRVRLFAGAAAAAGTEEDVVVVTAGAAGATDGGGTAPTVADLRHALVARHPALGPVLEVATVLVGEVAAGPGDPVVVGPQDPMTPPVVDVLPPFAGG